MDELQLHHFKTSGVDVKSRDKSMIGRGSSSDVNDSGIVLDQIQTIKNAIYDQDVIPAAENEEEEEDHLDDYFYVENDGNGVDVHAKETI